VQKPTEQRELLVLIFALFGGDAEITQKVLASVEIESEVCSSIESLTSAMLLGAGALVIAEEALVPEAVDELTRVLATQSSWSDLPIIVSAAERAGRDGLSILKRLGEHGNVSLLERPVRVRAMIGAVKNALRARRRQYATRQLISDLAASEARFRSVQEQAPYGLGIFAPVHAPDGSISDFEWLFANSQAAKTLGRSASALVGKTMLEVSPGNVSEGHFQVYVHAYETGEVRTREFDRHLDGFEGSFRGTAFRLDQNLALVFEDVTDRKRVEDERQRLLTREQAARADAEAVSRSKDEFLATVSHELRTPLNAMLGWARMLTSGRLDAEKSQRGLQAIERNALAQAQLIEDLLDVSRIISGKIRLDLLEVAFPKVVEAAVEAIRPALEAKEIRFAQVIDPSASLVMGDPNRLQQVIWNLLSNAIKFTPKGGHVQLALTRVESHVELTVSDDGQGIDAEFLPFLFQRFHQAEGGSTRRQGGLGLGLAICRHLVELHGGTIEASSAGVGKGALLRVKLPLMSVRTTPTDPQRVRPTLDRHVTFECPPELDGLRVLVVDDQPDTRDLLSSVIGNCNAVVFAACSSEEGLALVQKEKPDVIISDVGMPGEDGYAFIRRVRELAPEAGGRTPAAALTAYARAEDRRLAMRAGFEMHVPKPVEPSELLSIIATLARIGKAFR